MPFESERSEMVETQLRRRGIRDPRVLQAMLEVPRHEFVPESFLEAAYSDRPLPIGESETISQPYIVAFMSEAIRPLPTDRVLEVGTGSGYQAAVLSRLVRHIDTIEVRTRLSGRHAVAPATREQDNQRFPTSGSPHVVSCHHLSP